MRQATTAFSLDGRPYVAVATLEGMLVKSAPWQAYKFQIWGTQDTNFFLIEERDAPEPGGGAERVNEMVSILKDCRAVLVSRIGESPRKILKKTELFRYKNERFYS